MQDVIFAGTENRKPLGYAYVAITLDNSDHSLAIDFNEVTVARRVYRSGESEYLINGNPCRLKEVSELFYDTGIGKEGYSIIGQGQIDRILSGKPEERRELFDEAVVKIPDEDVRLALMLMVMIYQKSDEINRELFHRDQKRIAELEEELEKVRAELKRLKQEE